MIVGTDDILLARPASFAVPVKRGVQLHGQVGAVVILAKSDSDGDVRLSPLDMVCAFARAKPLDIVSKN